MPAAVTAVLEPGGMVSAPGCLGKVPRDALKSFPHSKRVGSYLVGKMINKGSFAKVMEGLHICSGEKVAIKVIDKKKAKQDSYVLKNMKREPHIHQMIRHPNVVQLYETLETENSYYMVMELCVGGDLMERLCERQRLGEREARRYARHILSAVEHLHRHGVVHRDLKIENFLLDENNNIKVVDFGLSNTLKAEALSPELLHTQCGSPAYAAPELLAHRKYGPKVDVWSVGVSTFAMLTGTLPFTVEPFNIKQLHQKMVNGEIGTFPSDISKAAVQFVLTLLEPDPEKRPSVREAMEQKWLNEGYSRRPLNCILYKNRLEPDELNPTVLNYMTESLGYGLSDIMHTLINNRPSSIMATYCLLVKKLEKHQKGAKSSKKENSVNRKSKPSSKSLGNPSEDTELEDTRNTMDSSPREDILKAEGNGPPPPAASLSAEGITDDEITITLENKEPLFPEVSAFADRELVHLSSPKTSDKERSDSKLLETSPCDTSVSGGLRRDINGALKPQKLLEPNGPVELVSHTTNEKLEKIQTFYLEKGVTPRALLENRGHSRSPEHQDTRVREFLHVMEEKPSPGGRWHPPGPGESPHTPPSPLPKLHHAGLRDGITRKLTWVGVARHSSGRSPLLMNGSRPPMFPSSRQQTLIIKSLRHPRERIRGPAFSAGDTTVKCNTVQLRNSHKGPELNLPVLAPPSRPRLPRGQS
ncbi:hormonally up-regulated neu tumor-associated kinase [Scleropages formosus]|uniref:hormonally up-regulated neu tumor-associated kinase n=1 Tax=Scleropages formosus TaxID=113540 RepID=UPI000878BB3C|nr:hormonally up-regulated neu tumor-associated kinase-like [Scleropages formosus]